jgi:hypothetical protein
LIGLKEVIVARTSVDFTAHIPVSERLSNVDYATTDKYIKALHKYGIKDVTIENTGGGWRVGSEVYDVEFTARLDKKDVEGFIHVMQRFKEVVIHLRKE